MLEAEAPGSCCGCTGGSSENSSSVKSASGGTAEEEETTVVSVDSGGNSNLEVQAAEHMAATKEDVVSIEDGSDM